MTSTSCPLCYSSTTTEFFVDRVRVYRRCENCALVFVPNEYHLTPADEKAEYDLHQNSPHDAGYRRFLSRLFVPTQRRLQPESVGLDFGSGPGPTLSVMFAEAGHNMMLYDPFYAPGADALQQRYDFITASEVVEHLRDPRMELDRLWSLLSLDGLLGIMTKRVYSQEAFTSWHYKDDMTHICFFSDTTFQWLARLWEAELEIVDNDVVIFRK